MTTTETTPQCMDITKIRQRAESIGIDPGKMKMAELVHSIQIAEGCSPCFGESAVECSNTDCCFMPDCLGFNLTESRQAEQNVEQQATQLTVENEQLQGEVVKSKRREKSLKHKRSELEIDRGQLEQDMKDQTHELTVTNRRLQREITKHRGAEKNLNQQLQRETTKRRRAEKNLGQLRGELDNTNFAVRTYLKVKKIRPRRSKPLSAALMSASKSCGRMCGLFVKPFC